MATLTGQMDLTVLSTLVKQPTGARLLLDAAASLERVCREVERLHGWWPTLTSAGDAYRSYERQAATFLGRYQRVYTEYADGKVDRRVWDDEYARARGLAGTYYRRAGYAAAAVPGQSNHGRGDTVDIAGLGGFTGVRYRQFAAVATAHGWSNAEGRTVDEAWHWRYFRSRDARYVANPVIDARHDLDVPVITDLPDPLPMEDDMYDASARAELLGHLEGLTANVSALVNALQTPSTGLAAVASDTREQVVVTREQAAAAATLAQQAVNGFNDPTIGALPQLVRLRGEVAGITEALSQVAAGNGTPLDITAISNAAERGAREALTDLTLTVKTGA